MADGDSVQRLNIRIQEDSLQCLKDGREVWRMPIHALLLIAEYTTGQGPFIDDYFLNFWTFENSEFIKYSISFYADGRDATFEALAQRLGAELQFGLTGSTEWASRAMWPPELAGHPYYTFRKLEPKTWLQKLRRLCFGPAEEYFIAKEVREYLKCHEGPKLPHDVEQPLSTLTNRLAKTAAATEELFLLNQPACLPEDIQKHLLRQLTGEGVLQ